MIYFSSSMNQMNQPGTDMVSYTGYTKGSRSLDKLVTPVNSPCPTPSSTQSCFVFGIIASSSLLPFQFSGLDSPPVSAPGLLCRPYSCVCRASAGGQWTLRGCLNRTIESAQPNRKASPISLQNP